jgi:hypothetical protein
VFFVVREFTITYHAPISRAGTVRVQLWLDHLGTTSVVYGFRVLSDDGTVVHAGGAGPLEPGRRHTRHAVMPGQVGALKRAASRGLAARGVRSLNLDSRCGNPVEAGILAAQRWWP